MGGGEGGHSFRKFSCDGKGRAIKVGMDGGNEVGESIFNANREDQRAGIFVATEGHCRRKGSRRIEGKGKSLREGTGCRGKVAWLSH